MANPDFQAALADYLSILEASAQKTSRAEDRTSYQRHLAAAARMFLAIYQGDIPRLRELVSAENHGYGWGYLTGDEGSAAEATWARFAANVGKPS